MGLNNRILDFEGQSPVRLIVRKLVISITNIHKICADTVQIIYGV